jgi:hypothetical protein
MMRVVAIVCLLATIARAAPGSRALDETLEDDEAAGERADGLVVDAGAAEPPDAASIAGAPPIASVINAAYVAAGLDRDPAHGWLRRARISGLVPWVTLRGAQVTTWSDPATDIGHSTTYEVRATWRLDRLLYDGRELQIAGAEAARRREKRRIASRVIRSYFTWQRARSAAVRHPTWASHAEEAAAELDALTDGWFGETLARKSGSRPVVGQ